MDLSKNAITLQGNSLDDVKKELEVHLSKALTRQKPDKVFTSYAIPMGFGASIEPDCEYKAFVPFSVCGTLSNFTSVTPIGAKEIFMEFKVTVEGTSQVQEKKLQDGFRSYAVSVTVPRSSYATLTIKNKSKIAAEVIVGFTFKEGAQDEIKTLGLVGTL